MNNVEKSGAKMLDSERLRNYARFILLTRQDIEDVIKNLLAKMNEINDGWQDAQNKKFTDAFIPHTENIKKLNELLDRYATFCNDNAHHIETEYNVNSDLI